MNWRWIFLMAYRDSRKNRSRLFLFISSIILGIASLVALNSFNENLKNDINLQAAQLIGADLEVSHSGVASDEALALIDSLKNISDAYSTEQRFMSMLRFQKSNDVRLVQIRAIVGGYPFYGEVETYPKNEYANFGAKNAVLIEKSLMLQYDAAASDTVQLGLNKFLIGGTLLVQPGQTAIRGAVAPSVFVPLNQLTNSGLQQEGSRIEYHHYYKFPSNLNIESLIDGMKDRLALLMLRTNTIASTKENTGRSFADMASFMELTGFVALLLGCIGVSSSVFIYVREKLVSVSILRCLGANAKQAFLIFLVQFAGIGFLGGVIGALLGSLIQYFIPMVMQDLVPVALSNAISWIAIVKGIGLGVIISILFALPPLISIRHISPLNSLRVSDQPNKSGSDKLSWLVYFLIVVFIVVFARLQLSSWLQTTFFTIGIGVVFLMLYATAKTVSFLVKKYFPKNWSYVWRQGLSNLYRPNNQTVVLLMSIGLGTALIATLVFTQNILLERVQLASSESQANMMLFDIQPSQRDQISKITVDKKLPVIEEVPIVTMQISSINGVSQAEVLKDSTSLIDAKAFRSEIRATYRDSLAESEKIISGKFVGNVNEGDAAQVSLDQVYAKDLGVKIGDSLVFNVQNVLIPAVVSSIRDVDWKRFQSNFRVVFAKGSIDQAPQFYLMMTRIDDEVKAVAYQQAIVSQFPNVSVMDMSTIIKVLEDILSKIGFVIQFIGGFSIFTGIVVLISSVRISKYQRIRENVLLRTLGASRRQILLITVSEYLFLGVLASIVGLIIAVIASFLFATLLIKTTFTLSFGIIFLLIFLVSALTILIGMLNSQTVLNRPPLEVLRKD